VHLDPNQIHYGEWIITGSADSTPENMHRALTLIESGKVQTEALISHHPATAGTGQRLRDGQRIGRGRRS
jgi:threonine dehydrogenase-like Zn-dependent dehydrogenase